MEVARGCVGRSVGLYTSMLGCSILHMGYNGQELCT